MKALFFTNEYPPYVYGGAGVHVEYLTRELAHLMQVEVRAFGDQNAPQNGVTVTGFSGEDQRFAQAPKSLKGIFTTLQRCVGFVGNGIDHDVVHCHTWYTHMAGIWAKLNYGVPLVITTHSLEPLRPWKREQLGGGYDFSCWVEKMAIEMADAVIAVSHGTKQDVLDHFKVCPDKIKIIYNGIDTDEFHKVAGRDTLAKHGINPAEPYVLFVGRITRQKGIIHLVRAIQHICPKVQVVLCAGAPDTPEIAEEMRAGVTKVQETRKNVIWIREMVDRKTLIELYSHAAVFCCPSIYEPFGIINLEAMACEVPVVASSVGGIKEVVVPDETGYLVPLAQMKESPFEALDPEKFSRDLAERINHLIAHPDLRVKMGKAGRKRTEDIFSWRSIAKQTFDLYSSLKS
jgi:glycogen synthase